MKTRSQALWTLAALCGGVSLALGGCGSLIDPAGQEQFIQDVGHTSLTVFPAVVRSDAIAYDAPAAQRLGQFLNDRKLAEASVSDVQVPITGGWSYNEAKMWRESAQALAAYVKEHPISTKYALLPEYLGVNDRGPVGGVHFYVVDRDGKVVSGLLLNSHHKAFTDANPKTVDDCTALLLQVIPQEWKAK
jgi:hypothetical protein